jgi:hypothetical protein
VRQWSQNIVGAERLVLSIRVQGCVIQFDRMEGKAQRSILQ